MAKNTALLWARGRKLLHWATGDRPHEAGALVDEGHAVGIDVGQRDAEREVHRQHGDLGLGTKGAAEPDVPEPTSSEHSDA